jgi:hypothetical protein
VLPTRTYDAARLGVAARRAVLSDLAHLVIRSLPGHDRECPLRGLRRTTGTSRIQAIGTWGNDSGAAQGAWLIYLCGDEHSCRRRAPPAPRGFLHLARLVRGRHGSVLPPRRVSASTRLDQRRAGTSGRCYVLRTRWWTNRTAHPQARAAPTCTGISPAQVLGGPARPRSPGTPHRDCSALRPAPASSPCPGPAPRRRRSAPR